MIVSIVMWIAAICATSFPVLYLFSPWYSTDIGKILMLQSFVFAIVIDLSLVGHYWTRLFEEEITLLYVIVFGLVAVSTASMTTLLWRTNYRRRSIRGRHHYKADA